MSRTGPEVLSNARSFYIFSRNYTLLTHNTTMKKTSMLWVLMLCLCFGAAYGQKKMNPTKKAIVASV